MAKSVLNATHFKTEGAAVESAEAHLRPNSPVRPFCGETGNATFGVTASGRDFRTRTSKVSPIN